MTHRSQQPLDEFEGSLIRRICAGMGFVQETKRQPRIRLIQAAECLEQRQLLSASAGPGFASDESRDSEQQMHVSYAEPKCAPPHFSTDTFGA